MTLGKESFFRTIDSFSLDLSEAWSPGSRTVPSNDSRTVRDLETSRSMTETSFVTGLSETDLIALVDFPNGN